MLSYLDNLPNDILFHIISYIDDKYTLDKLIYSIPELSLMFFSDDVWKQMFYQNIINPVINKDHLWKSNYYDNLTIETKYKLKSVNTNHLYDIIIISTAEDNQDLIDTIKNKSIDPDDFLNLYNTQLLFVTDVCDRFGYINPKYTKIVEDLRNINFDIRTHDLDLSGCVGIISEINVKDILHRFTQSVYSDNFSSKSITQLVSFEISNHKVIYITS